MNIPADLRYTKDHEWAKIQGAEAAIGITDHAQSSLGDIVFVELPKVGRKLKAGESFGVVESIKAVSELFSPLDGEVAAVNDGLTKDPSVINREPYASWMIKLKVSAPTDALMDSAAYTKLVG